MRTLHAPRPKPQNQDINPLGLATTYGHEFPVYPLLENGDMSLNNARMLMGPAIGKGNFNTLEQYCVYL
jgi:hypothetical protein